MIAWAYRLSQGVREVRDSWKSSRRQEALERAVDTLSRRPRAGRYLAEDRAWVYETAEAPRLRVTYRLDRERRQVNIEHVALVQIPRREIDVFLSYSRINRAWFRLLRRALQPLREFDIVLWTDQDLLAGQNWHQLIQSKVANSGAAVLLVSEAFLGSEYIQAHELDPFVARAERARVGGEDRPFLLLWIPLAHERLLKLNEWGRRLLPFQALVDPRKPLAPKPPARAQRTLEHIRELVHVSLHKLLRNAES